MQAITDSFFLLYQAIEHLDSTLGISNIEYLVHLSLILDEFYVDWIVIDSHLSPVPCPEFLLVNSEAFCIAA